MTTQPDRPTEPTDATPDPRRPFCPEWDRGVDVRHPPIQVDEMSELVHYTEGASDGWITVPKDELVALGDAR